MRGIGLVTNELAERLRRQPAFAVIDRLRLKASVAGADDLQPAVRTKEAAKEKNPRNQWRKREAHEQADLAALVDTNTVPQSSRW